MPVGLVLVALGVWFFVVALWAFTHAERQPGRPMPAVWLSYPGGRRVGGALVMAMSVVMIVAGLLYR